MQNDYQRRKSEVRKFLLNSSWRFGGMGRNPKAEVGQFAPPPWSG